MFEKNNLENINDYLKQINEREKMGIYFYKLTFYNEEIKKFLKKYIKKVKENGIYIKDGLKNPTLNNIAYFNENIGNDFILEKNFFEEKLKKWLPQLNISENKEFSNLIFDALIKLQENGKNMSILKNIYMKFMCWSYYKFQYVIKNCFINNKKNNPKILFEGTPSLYELNFLNIISQLGCDVLFLEYQKDNNDIPEILSSVKEEFPKNFSLESLIEEENEEEKIEKVIGKNGIIKKEKWINGEILEEVLKSVKKRGEERDVSYALFAKILGVKDVENYELNLLRFKLKIEDEKRKFLILENEIKNPEYDEVMKIRKPLSNNKVEILVNLSKNICIPNNLELTKNLQSIFIAISLESKEENLQKFINRSIIIICWLNRYIKILFEKSSEEYYPMLIYFGSCNNFNEKMFLKILSRINVDVIIICSDKNKNFELNDEFLIEKIYEDSYPIKKFPVSMKDLKLRTVASNAENDLEEILYKDTGLYKVNQFKKAVPVILNTTYEEIKLLWREELKYRQKFETIKDTVILPSICARIIGVPDKNINAYWKIIENYIQEEEYFLINFPLFQIDKKSIFNISNFFENGKINLEKIKYDKRYKYGFLREEMQNYILEKFQSYIENKSLKLNNLENKENEILSILLNLDIELLRRIQNFDFAKKNPKIVILDTKESRGEIEDAIIIEFLIELGFDVLIFVPTGYRSLESYYSKKIFVEHQIGEFVYELKIPNFDKEKKRFITNKIDLKSIFNILN